MLSVGDDVEASALFAAATTEQAQVSPNQFWATTALLSRRRCGSWSGRSPVCLSSA
jgi:hypothetical protein